VPTNELFGRLRWTAKASDPRESTWRSWVLPWDPIPSSCAGHAGRPRRPGDLKPTTTKTTDRPPPRAHDYNTWSAQRCWPLFIWTRQTRFHRRKSENRKTEYVWKKKHSFETIQLQSTRRRRYGDNDNNY